MSIIEGLSELNRAAIANLQESEIIRLHHGLGGAKSHVDAKATTVDSL
jgi:hypothetical protein